MPQVPSGNLHACCSGPAGCQALHHQHHGHHWSSTSSGNRSKICVGFGEEKAGRLQIKNSSKQQCYLLSTRQLHRASSSAVRGQGQADLPCPHAACDQASSSCGCTNKTLAWTKSTHKQLLAGTTGQAPPHRLHPQSGRAGS